MGEPNSHGLKGFERLGAATRCERTTDQWSHHSPGFSPLTCVPWRYLVVLCVYAFAQVEWRVLGLVAAETLFKTPVDQLLTCDFSAAAYSVRIVPLAAELAPGQ